jgi:hypothetical protein
LEQLGGSAAGVQGDGGPSLGHVPSDRTLLDDLAGFTV